MLRHFGGPSLRHFIKKRCYIYSIVQYFVTEIVKRLDEDLLVSSCQGIRTYLYEGYFTINNEGIKYQNLDLVQKDEARRCCRRLDFGRLGQVQQVWCQQRQLVRRSVSSEHPDGATSLVAEDE